MKKMNRERRGRGEIEGEGEGKLREAHKDGHVRTVTIDSMYGKKGV